MIAPFYPSKLRRGKVKMNKTRVDAAIFARSVISVMLKITLTNSTVNFKMRQWR